MTSNPWDTDEGKKILGLVEHGAAEGASMKGLCRSTCQDLAQDVVHQMVRRPYTPPRDPYSYGKKAGYFRACSFLRRKSTEDRHLENEQRFGNSGTGRDVLSHAVKQEDLQRMDMFLKALSMEEMVLIYGTAVLGESVASVASLLNKASGACLTSEAYRARLMKLKKRAIQTLDVAM